MRWTFMLAALLVGLLTCAFVHAEEVAPPPDPFAGNWRVSITPDTTTAQQGVLAFDDTLTFDGGQFSVEACSMLGFSMEQHTVATSTNGNPYFTVTTTSASHGSMAWKGWLTTSGFLGRLTWTKTDGSVAKYTFSGSKVVE